MSFKLSFIMEYAGICWNFISLLPYECCIWIETFTFHSPAPVSTPQLLLSDASAVYRTSLDGSSTEVTLSHPESLSPVKGRPLKGVCVCVCACLCACLCACVMNVCRKLHFHAFISRGLGGVYLKNDWPGELNY